MTSKHHEELIDEVIGNFNFTSVHIAMTALDWKWHDKGVPAISDLKACACRILGMAMESGCSCVSTGGFTAEFDKNARFDGRGVLSLEFTLESFSTTDEE